MDSLRKGRGLSIMNEEQSRITGIWPMSNEELLQWFSRDNLPIQELTQMWLSMDQNPGTKSEITELLKKDDTPELEQRLRHRIQFGTAGTYSMFWKFL